MSVGLRCSHVGLFVAVLVSTGCASGRATAPFRPNAPVVTDRQVIPRDEILGTQYTNLYDVVLALRGNWLRLRSAESFEKSSVVQVYLDSQRVGSAVELRTIVPSTVYSVRFLDPITATGRYGMDHGAGAIIVTTARN